MALTLIRQKNVTELHVREVSYEINKTEGGGKESCGAGCDQRGYEQSVVA